jgi:hypothetical protein
MVVRDLIEEILYNWKRNIKVEYFSVSE